WPTRRCSARAPKRKRSAERREEPPVKTAVRPTALAGPARRRGTATRAAGRSDHGVVMRLQAGAGNRAVAGVLAPSAGRGGERAGSAGSAGSDVPTPQVLQRLVEAEMFAPPTPPISAAPNQDPHFAAMAARSKRIGRGLKTHPTTAHEVADAQ